MTSGIVWAVTAIVVVLLGVIGRFFSLRTLRWAAVVTAMALAIAVARYGASHPAHAPSDLVSSFLRGIDAVTKALLHPLWLGHPVPAPGTVGRVIIAVLVILGYRQLETWTLRWQAPTLDMTAIGEIQPGEEASAPPALPGMPASRVFPASDGMTAIQRHDQLAAELRFRLPTMEIRAPAILPGGTRSQALASIAEWSGVTGGGLAGAVIRAASLFWPKARAIRVRVWVEAPVAVGIRATVVLEDARSGVTISTKTVTGADLPELASMAAGYIARQIFEMDPTVPEWCYGSADGRDLGAMQQARLARVYAGCPRDVLESREVQIDILRKATGNVRSAGIVRYELAQLYALRGEHLAALRLHALNRELHPRFYRGRYRLGMSLEMIANPEHQLPDTPATRDGLDEVMQILTRCRLTTSEYRQANAARLIADNFGQTVPGAPGITPRHLPVPRELAMEMLRIAADDLAGVRRQLSLPNVVRAAFLHRSERAVWLPLWRRRQRESFVDGVCVAQLLVAVRLRLLEHDIEDPGWRQREQVPAPRVPLEPRSHGQHSERPAGAGRRHHRPRTSGAKVALAGTFGDAPVPEDLRHALRISSFIAGDPAPIIAALTGTDEWRTPRRAADGAEPSPATASRVRLLPWQRRTPSWQAAYNTAGVYAALADAAPAPAAPEFQERIINSLRAAVDNPYSELERASDWIRRDPDFRTMYRHPEIFGAFLKFLEVQERQDYPEAFLSGKHHAPHAADTTGQPGPRTPAPREPAPRTPAPREPAQPEL
jgi:hypothetical protein